MAAAGVCWAGAAAGLVAGFWALLGAALLAVVGLVTRRRGIVVAAVLFAAASGSGSLAAHRADATLSASVPSGRITVAGVVADDPRPHGDGAAFSLAPTHLLSRGEWVVWDGPTLAITVPAGTEVVAAERVIVAGRSASRPGYLRGDPVAATVAATSVDRVAGPADPLFVAGNALRRRVTAGLDGASPPAAAALLSGFLIGDVRHLPGADAEALRLAGLSHFVAVSGSNVALFLAAWWLVAGPLGFGERRRALIGLAGLAVFVVVTRWEPSVLRAAVMVAIVLGGRVLRIPVDAWTALGIGTGGLLLVSGHLAVDVGFQLSAAATAGVMAGSRLFSGRRPRWAWSAAGATLAAQAAVFPLLLAHFGSVPLLAPVANLVAAPLVTVATAVGGAGVIAGITPVRDLGVLTAGAVLGLARTAAGWPQLGWPGSVVAVTAAALAVRRRGLRPVLGGIAAGALVFTVVVSAPWPQVPTVTVLDVGEGDAILVQDPGGGVMLVDGGRDPIALGRRLRAHGVERIDLLVATHGDADHAGGLAGLPLRMPVGRVWYPEFAITGPQIDDLLAAATDTGTPVEAVTAGRRVRLGATGVEVLGPRRRYAVDNDGSVVLVVTGPAGSMLLPGDIEAVAQRDLGPVGVDAMVVPHHGSATTDPGWLAATVPDLAVISVGPNTYGHPHPDIVGMLDDLGVTVLRTDEAGDVAVRLGTPAGSS